MMKLQGKSHSRFALAFAALFALLSCLSVPAQEAVPSPERVELKLYYRHLGYRLATPAANGAEPTDATPTHSIVLSQREAFNPVTNEPFVTPDRELGCDPADVRFAFRLSKREFLLGEPIIVEHRVALHGAGRWEWSEGGNYRSRGRDDNYLYILRDASGKLVADPFGFERSPGGGLGSFGNVTRDKPYSTWLAVQQYAALMRPGTYDLYCIRGTYKVQTFGTRAAMEAALPEHVRAECFFNSDGILIDRQTGEPTKRYELAINDQTVDRQPSPLAGLLPSDIIERLRAEGTWVAAVAHFTINVRQGTPTERRRMVAKWTDIAEAKSSSPEISAAREAIWFASQPYFLPLLERWILAPRADIRLRLTGLAMRGDRAAIAILLKAAPKDAVSALYRLHPHRVPEFVPLCIEWLAHPDDAVRARAEAQLRRWTNQQFGHEWLGYHYQRPTFVEGRRMQPLWQAWWQEHKQGFRFDEQLQPDAW